MTTEDFIIDLFCRVDDRMKHVPQHGQAALWPSEVVTLGLLFALKGVGGRAFYRWLRRDYADRFPRVPERTRLFRRLKTQWRWTGLFLARPSLLGIVDSYGMELIHPVRRGRSPQQFGTAGISNHRWIVGAKWCVAVNHGGAAAGASEASGGGDSRIAVTGKQGRAARSITRSSFRPAASRGTGLSRMPIRTRLRPACRAARPKCADRRATPPVV